MAESHSNDIQFDSVNFEQFKELAAVNLPEVVIRTDARWAETVGTVLEDYLCSAWPKLPTTRGAKHAYVRASIETFSPHISTLIRAAARCLQIRLDPILNVTLEDIIDRMKSVFGTWTQIDFRSELNPWTESGDLPLIHKYVIDPNTDQLRDYLQFHRSEIRSELPIKSIKGHFPITRAVCTGQVANVELIIELDPGQLHLRLGPNQMTLLHLAVERRNISLVQVLIWLGIKVDARDKNYATPLEYAVTTKQYDIAELLLREGRRAIFNYNRQGFSLLHLDTSSEIIEMLVRAGVDPRGCVFGHTETPLTLMIDRENAITIIPTFIYACERMGYQVSDIINSCDCISRAAARRKCEVLELLIQFGGQPRRPIADFAFWDGSIPPLLRDDLKGLLIVSKAIGEVWTPETLTSLYVEFNWYPQELETLKNWETEVQTQADILECRWRIYFRQSLVVSLLRALKI